MQRLRASLILTRVQRLQVLAFFAQNMIFVGMYNGVVLGPAVVGEDLLRNFWVLLISWLFICVCGNYVNVSFIEVGRSLIPSFSLSLTSTFVCSFVGPVLFFFLIPSTVLVAHVSP